MLVQGYVSLVLMINKLMFACYYCFVCFVKLECLSYMKTDSFKLIEGSTKQKCLCYVKDMWVPDDVICNWSYGRLLVD